MSVISLRSYQQEIEQYIESRRIEEAIVHSRHILESFPRSINTYRLLGKAFLESQRYSDAADIFQRVLSSIPDDFISQIGMSIIREDEGNLDQALWHMERAFEVQPANGAIQDELRRLYEQRDGIEPPSIRLTRGALARMYAKGNLHQQAITEARAVLAKDSKRLEMQVLLANIFFQAGKDAEAVESANNVLHKLPYCLPANRIMVEVLTKSDRQTEAQPYLQKVNQLDPYSAFVSSTQPTSSDVPDDAIKLEKLEYTAGVSPGIDLGQPSWASSLGVEVLDLDGDSDEMPSWLSDALQDIPQINDRQIAATQDESSLEIDEQDVQTVDSSSTGEIPDWMQDAGWEPSTGSGEAMDGILSTDEDMLFGDGEDELAEADIPSWLQEIAPVMTEVTKSDEALTVDMEEFDIESEFPEWLTETNETEVEIPDWLHDVQEKLPETEGVTDSQLDEKNIGETPETSDDVEKITVEADGIDQFPEDKPPGVSDEDVHADEADDEASSAEGFPEWLAGVAAASTVAKAASDREEALDAHPSEVGLDISDEGELEAQEVESITESEDDAPEIPEWLEGFDDSAPSTEPTKAKSGIEAEQEDELPEWLVEDEGSREMNETEADLDSEFEPSEELPDWLMESGESDDRIDVIANEVDDKRDDLPFEEIPEGAEAEDSVKLEPTDEIPDWLAEAVETDAIPEPISEHPEAAAEPIEALPEWLTEITNAQPDSEPFPAEEISPEGEIPETEIREKYVMEAESEQELPDWLKVGAVATTTAAVSAVEHLEGETTPDEDEPHDEKVSEIRAPVVELQEEPTSELPDWLEEIDTETEEIPSDVVAEAPAVPAEHIPEWLIEPSETKVTEVEVEAEPSDGELFEDIPSWLVESEPKEIEEQIRVDEHEKKTERDQDQLLTPAAVAAMATAAAAKDSTSDESAREERMEQAPTEATIDEVESILGDTQPSKPRPTEELTPPVEEEVTEDEFAFPADSDDTDIGLETAKEQIPEAEIQEQPADQIAPALKPEETSIAGQTSEDDDAAFAWLESLAVKQGAEEALLLSSEERQETPPEWVQEAELVGDEDRQAEFQIEPPEIQDQASVDQEGELSAPALIPSTDDQVEQPQPTVSELAQPDAEITEDEMEIEEAVEAKPEEDVPDLPEWLDEGQVEDDQEPFDWTPPDVMLDINRASLAELERLPGIGFILAQRIINRREKKHYEQLKDLLEIPGVDQALLDELEDRLYVEPKLEPEPAPGPLLETEPADESEPIALTFTEVDAGPELMQARNSLSEGEIPHALEAYANLIKSHQYLPEVIQDLEAASDLFPQDVDLWQNLGDAYLRSNQIQEALEAYIKAEKLLHI